MTSGLTDGIEIEALEQPAFTTHEVIEGSLDAGLVLVCDHARNAIPPQYHNLGVPPGELERHIAYDIGTEAVTRQLASQMGVPAVLSHFSRLLIDPNRGVDDPTLIMRLSDGAIIPGNADICETERQTRINKYYTPYHDAVTELIGRAKTANPDVVVFSIHSFTPVWKGVPRPWHVGILWEENGRLAKPLIAALKHDRELVVGENQPYSGGVEGESMDKHARRQGIPAALLEIRQDLIANKEGVDEWVTRLAPILEDIIY